MRQLKTVIHFLTISLFLSFLAVVSASAQPPGGNTGDAAGGQMGSGPMGQQSGPGGQGGMQMQQQDPAQMQQMMAQRYQELLGMSDDEWAVIGPYVLKVSELSSATQSRGGMRMMMGRGNMTGGTQGQDQAQNQNQSGDQTQSQGQRNRGNMMGQNQSGDENLQALQTLLEDENATSDEIKSKLSALRKAREASKRELAAAQKELRELLTLRQEAMLVVTGLLE